MYKYRDLIVWQRAMELAQRVYQVTQRFPKEELYGLVSQMRRAAVSVPSNVAEGQGRLHKPEFRQFLGQARGSLLELETQAELAHRLGYLTLEEKVTVEQKSEEICRMLSALISKLET